MSDKKIKQPPQALESERALIGCLLIDNRQAEIVRGLITPEMFYKETISHAYTAILGIIDKGQAADIVTVTAALKGKIKNSLPLVGCMELVSTPKTAALHAKKIHDAYLSRTVIKCLNQITEAAYESSDSEELIDQLTENVADIEREFGEGAEYWEPPETIKEQLQRVHALLENIQENRTLPGLSTGFEKLDRLIYGLRPQTITIIAARTGQGKTALALNIADNIVAQGKKVLFISYEMTADQLLLRILSQRTSISTEDFMTGQIGVRWGTVTDCFRYLKDSGWIIRIKPGWTLPKYVSFVHRAFQRDPDIAAVFVDYIGLMKCDSRQNRNDFIGDVMRENKTLAIDLNVPFVLLSQLNRGLESMGKKPRRPRLSDLRESGNIEQDANAVLMIFRPGEYPKDKHPKTYTELLLNKNRDGRTGIIYAHFEGEYTRFSEMTNQQPPDEPDGEDYDLDTDDY